MRISERILDSGAGAVATSDCSPDACCDERQADQGRDEKQCLSASGELYPLGLKSSDVPPAERVVRPALIVVDLQNDFVLPGAPLEVPEARATIAVNQKLVEYFRVNRLPVIFTRFVSRPTDKHFWRWSPECDPRERCCWAGQRRLYKGYAEPKECIDVIDELAPTKSDYVVDKNYYGAFHGTDLAKTLQALDVGSVVVTGTVTQICVDQTAREAFQNDLNAVVVSDAVSSSSPELASYALENIKRKFGWVATSEEVITWLDGHLAAGRAAV